MEKIAVKCTNTEQRQKVLDYAYIYGKVEHGVKIVSDGWSDYVSSYLGTHGSSSSFIGHTELTYEEFEKKYINPEKPSEWIPKVGEYAVMERAGGWGYRPENNGCIAIITGVKPCECVPGGTIPQDTYKISGKLLNPKIESHYTKFSNIPIKTDQGYICRKALSHEIPEDEFINLPDNPKYIVVQCPTLWKWNFVLEKTGDRQRLTSSKWNVYKEKSCIVIKGTEPGTYSGLDFFQKNNSLIYTFKEWCQKEGYSPDKEAVYIVGVDPYDNNPLYKNEKKAITLRNEGIQINSEVSTLKITMSELVTLKNTDREVKINVNQLQTIKIN